ncbi:hypothetical protein [Oerskovia flava]|uniref:hypothetical protein n=1 Tax=Oerskovia flava TaxID=2986422 RepID=UPI00223EA940|nr:hypothetical protein [Oerskovia sp. JB1-3-2]
MTEGQPPRPDPAPPPLRVTTVLASELPQSLGTADSPASYTIPTLLSRAPTPAEQELVEGPASHAHLAARGYPEVRLTVRGRRLLVDGSTLTALEDGLAHEIAFVVHRLANEGSEAADVPVADRVARIRFE